MRGVDVLDDFFAPVGLDVDVDVGRLLGALGAEEPFEHEVEADGVDRRDLECVAHRGVRGRAASLAEDVVLTAVPGDVPDDEEVAGEAELLDDLQLLSDLPVRPLFVRLALEAPGRALVGEMAQVFHLSLVTVLERERRQLRGDEIELERQVFAQLDCVLHGARPAGEPGLHLRAGTQVLVGPRRQPPVDLVEAAACPDRGDGSSQLALRRPVVVRGRGRDDR
jgi:hypothetical protein